MKILYIITLLLIAVLQQVHGQYIPNSGQGFQFASAYNAAFVGVDEFTDVRFGYRYQMAGYGSNSPQFVNLAANFRLKQPVDLTTNALRPANASSLSNLVPKRKRIIHGLGVTVFSEKVGLIKRLGGGLSYAFNYPVSRKFRLAAGVTAFLENTQLDMSGIYLGESPDPDPYYNQLMKGSTKHSEFSLRGGLLLYSKGFYLGVSYFPIMNTVIQNSDVNFSQTNKFYQGSVLTGFALPVNADLMLKPSVLAVVQSDHKVLLDYSIKGYLKSKAWFGATYRDIQALVFLLGFDFTKTFAVSYSYEMSVGGLSKFNDGSHDLVLGLRFNNFKGQRAYTW